MPNAVIVALGNRHGEAAEAYEAPCTTQLEMAGVATRL